MTLDLTETPETFCLLKAFHPSCHSHSNPRDGMNVVYSHVQGLRTYQGGQERRHHTRPCSNFKAYFHSNNKTRILSSFPRAYSIWKMTLMQYNVFLQHHHSLANIWENKGNLQFLAITCIWLHSYAW